MTSLALLALLLTLAAGFGFLNIRLLHLPTTIGVLVVSLAASPLLLLTDPIVHGVALRALAKLLLDEMDLPSTLMDRVLSFLLFAGAAWLVFGATGQPVGLAWCVVLGAILAPTDPVSGVGLLKLIGLPPGLQAVFAGESLFNDDVGVVVFAVALKVALGTAGLVTPGAIAAELAIEAAGGSAIGLMAGRPSRSASGAIQEVHRLICRGYTDVVDADLSKYFDMIPHADLLKSVARRISDRHMLWLIKLWLKAPVEERDGEGKSRMSGGKTSTCGTPQGGVASPLLANLHEPLPQALATQRPRRGVPCAHRQLCR